MTTTDSLPIDFLLVLAVGGLLSGIAWFLTRRFLQPSHWSRAVVCLLIGATVTPTWLPVWDSLLPMPAIIAVLVLMFDGWKHTLFGLLYGVLPILLVSSGVFTARAISDSRRRNRAVSKPL